MRKIDLLDSLPTPARPIDTRAVETEEDKALSRKLGREYFDGTRGQGYGGYYYDGRWKSVARRMRDYYSLHAGSKVLDIGCAKGFLLHDFLEEVPGIQVAGVDISEYALRKSSEKTRPFLYLANAHELPFESKTFDFTVTINSLHNILTLPEVLQAVREIERVTAGGKYIRVAAYSNAEEKAVLDRWAVVATTYLHVNDWLELFSKAGYTGDYYWWHPLNLHL